MGRSFSMTNYYNKKLQFSNLGKFCKERDMYKIYKDKLFRLIKSIHIHISKPKQIFFVLCLITRSFRVVRTKYLCRYIFFSFQCCHSQNTISNRNIILPMQFFIYGLKKIFTLVDSYICYEMKFNIEIKLLNIHVIFFCTYIFNSYFTIKKYALNL